MNDENKNNNDIEPEESAGSTPETPDESVEDLLSRVDDLLAGVSAEEGEADADEAVSPDADTDAPPPSDDADEAAPEDSASDFLATFSESLEKPEEVVDAAAVDAAEELVDAAAETVDAISDGATEQVDGAGDLADEASESVADASEEVQSDVAEAVEAVADPVEEVVADAEETLSHVDDAVDAAADVVEETTEEVEESLVDAVSDVEDVAQEAGNAVAASATAAAAGAAAKSASAKKKKKGSSKNKAKSKKRTEVHKAGAIEAEYEDLTPQQKIAKRDEIAAKVQQEEAKEVVAKYGKMVAIAVIGILAVFLVYGVITKNATQARSDSWRAFNEAQTPEQLIEVVDNYGDSKSAPLALISAAKQRFNEDQLPAALDLYVRFVNTYPNHQFAPDAEYGKLFCLEATGEVEQALAGWDKFLAANPDHYLMPSATLAKARCLEHLDRIEEARTVYENFMAGNAGNEWGAQAEDLLNRISR